MKRLAALLALICAPGSGSYASAQDAAPAAPDAAEASAAPAEAPPEEATEAQLLEAYGRTAEPSLLLRVAQARFNAGDGPGAAEALERYLSVAPDAADAEGVRASLAQLRAAPAVLELRSSPEGATVSIDGEARGVTPLALELPPGAHRLELRLEGHEPLEDEVVLAYGSRRALGYELPPVPEAAPEADEPLAEEAVPGEASGPRGHRVAILTTASLAAAGLITGTALGFTALSKQADYDERPSASLADRGEALAMGADLAFAVGAAAGVSAIVLYFVDRRAEASRGVASAPSVRLVGASAGLGLGGSLEF